MGTYFCGKSNSSSTFTIDTDFAERTLAASAGSTQTSGTLTIETTRFGLLTISEEQIITVVGGLLGFPEYTRYIILNHDDDLDVPFWWLQSVENSALAFVITDPWICMANYTVELPDEICANLDLSEAQPPLILAIVTIPIEPSLLTANLQGPLVINSTTHRAQQAVLVDSPYTTRHSILAGLLRMGEDNHAASSVAHHPTV
jgi:flagellar assembly factor FliW